MNLQLVGNSDKFDGNLYNLIKLTHMPYNPNTHRRRSVRMQGYDYSQAGLYYVTICTQGRECLFGNITDKKMILNDIGTIAYEYLIHIPDRYPQTTMHAFVVMPNHVHAIIEILESGDSESLPVGAIHESPLQEVILHEKPPLSLRDQRRKMLLSKIMGWYKMNSAKHINIILDRTGIPFWQRSFHDHIIRDEQSYLTIKDYINNNPANWNDDPFYTT